MSIESYTYGTLQNGQEVTGYVLRNKNGLEVRCINYGCRLTHIVLPSASGPADVVMGFDNLAGYEEDDSYQGAFIGRYANRIRDGRFSLNGSEYQLNANSNGNALHGSWHRRVFDTEIIGDNSLSFTYTSPDGEDGFPGEVWVGIIYTLTDAGELMMDYRARTSADTHINLTNHAYFNMAGQQAARCEDTLLLVNASRFVEVDERLCPTGRLLETEGGAFDFTSEKPIGRDIERDDPQLKIGGGYDHCFVLDKPSAGKLSLAASAADPASGRRMQVFTTQPAVQLYTGNMMGGAPGKEGRPLSVRRAFCLETQHYPDSPNFPEFPSTLLPKGGKYHEVTVLQFNW